MHVPVVFKISHASYFIQQITHIST